jgi:hypothetical protein
MMLTPKVSNVYNTNKIKTCDAEGIEPALTEISPANDCINRNFSWRRDLNLMTLPSMANFNRRNFSKNSYRL